MFTWYKLSSYLILFSGISVGFHGYAQRIYRPQSVLATGTWYKIGLKDPGVYKIDLPFLSSLGINTAGLSSASLRLFGNGGQMLSEKNADLPADDLEENAILVADGGDGIMNGTDYFLFYSAGPHQWIKDSVNQKFFHRKNIYSDSSYYFIQIGGSGKRISSLQPAGAPAQTISSFNERYFYETDLVNLLNSGREWYGEEFADAPGKTLTRSFPVSFPGLLLSHPVSLTADCISRSVNSPSRFDFSVAGQPRMQIIIPGTGPGVYDLFARSARQETSFLASQENLNITVTYVPGAFNAQGWLNWLELHARRQLILDGNNPLHFRDWSSLGNHLGEFILTNATAGLQVWEITDPRIPVQLQGNFTTNQFRFLSDCSRLREYVAFYPNGAKTPVPLGRIAPQNLHGSSPVDYLIITHPSLQSQAERLADFHRQKNNLRVFVTTAEKIYNEFSSGSPDVTAIRDFVKMYYDKAGSVAADLPRYLLLFGDASFDFQNRSGQLPGLVPAYQNDVALDPVNTYTSDDFFGFLDDHEDINSGLVTNLLDIGIGRVPAKNPEEAKNFVDKVFAYHSRESLQAWRNQLTFIADDEDNNLHLQDVESLTTLTGTLNPVFNLNKIYLDAFPQQSNNAGSRYPQVNESIINGIYHGTLIWNYSGHGSATRLAEEVIVDPISVQGWNNPFRLPLLVTATCDFAPYDNPFVQSLGENLLLRPRTGAIGLMTTTRLVSSFSNRVMNYNYLLAALQPDAQNRYKSLGEAVMSAKNFTYQTSGDVINNRKFTLLGDPALTLGFPRLQIKTTRVNGIDVMMQTDTLSAGELATLEGEITDHNGMRIPGFNGTIYPLVLDKPETVSTRANDAGSQVAVFETQKGILFRGKATVEDGRFRFSFRIPRDINYQPGKGKASYYAENGQTDAHGFFTGFIVAGSSAGADQDREGPFIQAWLNDEKFVNGSICNESPVLLLKFSDSSGINTTGAAIGHDITVIIDDDINRSYSLNNYYEADLDNYRRGGLRFQLPVLEPGFHSLKIKAWDVLNNSSEIMLDFVVVNDEEFSVTRVLNYPNPFSTRTTFWFEHNKPGQDLRAQLYIYTLSGRLIKTIFNTINTAGNRSCELEWDGRDEYGDRVGRGVYFYRLKITEPGGKSRSVIEKLVVF